MDPNTKENAAIPGLQVTEISEKEKSLFGINYGLRITNSQHLEPNGPNINEGFVITTINGIPVNSIEHFWKMLKENDGVMLGGIYSDGTHDHYFMEHIAI